MTDQTNESNRPCPGSRPTSAGVPNAPQALGSRMGPGDQLVRDTPQTSQNQSTSVSPSILDQSKDIANGAHPTSSSSVVDAASGSEYAAPAVHQAPRRLFGQYTTSDLFGGKTVTSVPVAQVATQPPHGGLFGGIDPGSNLFGGDAKPQFDSTNGRRLFKSGYPFQYNPNTGVGLFGRVGQSSSLREGGLFGHVATVSTESGRAEQNSSSDPDIRVLEGQAINFGCNLLTIQVGEDERARPFSIHSDILTAQSTYFKDSVLSDPEQRTICLPEINPRAFALYFQLIYTGRIPSKPNDASNTEHDEYALLCKLYVIAHFLEDTKAANTVLNAIFAKATESAEIPSSEHVWIVYAGTQGPCGARKMMVSFYTYKATREWMRAQGEDSQGRGFPPEFWSELAMSLLEKRSVPFGRIARMDAKEYYGQRDGGLHG